MTLRELKKGDHRPISDIVHDPEGHWRKLAAFGLMPGASVKMLQRWPTLVVQVGWTEVGLDEVTARLVILGERVPEQSQK